MINTTSFATLLRETFSNPDDRTRNRKEIEISEFIRSHPDQYASITADIFRSPHLDLNSRLLAITTFNQAFRLRKNDTHHAIWCDLPAATRRALKDAAFDLLVDPQTPLRKPGAHCLAQIYMLDLTSSRPELRDILNAVCSNVTNANLEFAGIAVVSLAAICDLLTPQRLTLLSDDEKEFLLAGVCNSMKMRNQNAQAILKGLTNAMPIMAPKFDNPSFLQFILEQLFDFIQFGEANPDEAAGLIHDAINCLGQVAKFAYFQMGQFMEVIIDKVLDLEKKGPLSVKKAACEFFIKCFKLERRRRTGYFDQRWKPLLDTALAGLGASIHLNDSSNEDVMELLENYSRILNNLNVLYSEQTFPTLGPLVSENLKSPNETAQVGAVMILESMVDARRGPQALDSFREVFADAFELIASARSTLLRIVALNCTERILAEFIPLVFERQNLPRLLDIHLNVILDQTNNDLAEQAKLLALNTLDQLAIKSKDQRQYLVPLQTHLTRIMDAMFTLAGSTPNPTIIDAVFSAMFSYIENVMEVDRLINYFQPLLHILETFRQSSASPNRQIYMESAIINLNLILTRLAMLNVPAFSQSDNRGQTLQQILMFIAGIFDDTPASAPECLSLMTTIIAGNPDIFRQAVVEFFDRYLKPSLSNLDEPTHTTAAIMSFVGLMKVYTHELTRPIHDFLQFVFVIVQNDLPRELRHPIFYFLSDVMIHLPDVARNFAEQILVFSIDSLRMVVQEMHADPFDDDTMASCVQIRDAAVEDLFCYIHGLFPLNDNNVFRCFEHRLADIQTLMAELTLELFNPSSDFLKQVVHFLSDCLARLKNRNAINLALLRSCYERMNPNDEEFPEIRNRIESFKLTP